MLPFFSFMQLSHLQQVSHFSILCSNLSITRYIFHFYVIISLILYIIIPIPFIFFGVSYVESATINVQYENGVQISP